MPWENNPLFWVVALYCGVPLVGFLAFLWFLKTIYGIFFGTVKSVVNSAASVPRQAIQTAGQAHIVTTITRAQLETHRLENPENYESVLRTRVWVAYALVGLIGGPILLVATVVLYLGGVIGGIALTAVDVGAFFGYVSYGFHLMDKARQGKNPKRIEQRDAQKRVAAGRTRPVAKTK